MQSWIVYFPPCQRNPGNCILAESGNGFIVFIIFFPCFTRLFWSVCIGELFPCCCFFYHFVHLLQIWISESLACFYHFLYPFARLYQSPRRSSHSSVSPYKWLREEFEHPSPEVETARRSLVFKLDEVSRGKWETLTCLKVEFRSFISIIKGKPWNFVMLDPWNGTAFQDLYHLY